jgi:hypothetical protein
MLEGHSGAVDGGSTLVEVLLIGGEGGAVLGELAGGLRRGGTAEEGAGSDEVHRVERVGEVLGGEADGTVHVEDGCFIEKLSCDIEWVNGALLGEADEDGDDLVADAPRETEFGDEGGGDISGLGPVGSGCFEHSVGIYLEGRKELSEPVHSSDGGFECAVEPISVTAELARGGDEGGSGGGVGAECVGGGIADRRRRPGCGRSRPRRWTKN